MPDYVCPNCGGALPAAMGQHATDLVSALVNLGYSPEEVHGIIQYVMGTLTLHDAPVINYETLLHKGFTEAELERIEGSLPGQFELSFAFS